MTSLSKLRCPRCGDKLSIDLDDCDTKNGEMVGYCWNPKHSRLKVKTVTKLRMKLNQKEIASFSMSDLLCILCGNKLWFEDTKSYVAGHEITSSCKYCRISFKSMGKAVKQLCYDEIFRFKIIKYLRL